MELELFLLGPVRATLGGRPLDSFRNAKTKALLLFLMTEMALAEEPHPHAREKLMSLLWPETLQHSAQVNLRQTLYQLRRVVPTVKGRAGDQPVPLLLADRQTVQINPQADYKLDVAEFLGLVTGQGMPAQLAQAVGLYRDSLLADFYLPDSEPFEEWVAARRASLHRMALGALEQLTDHFLEASDFGAAQRYARRQLELDEFWESGQRQLMLALAHGGQRTQALEQFESYRHALADELQAEPAPATVELAAVIRSGELLAGKGLVGRISDVTATAETPLRLKAPNVIQKRSPARGGWSSVFIGRERELTVLEAQLKRALQGEGRVVFVTGEAGEGKTSLLREFARRAQGARADIVIATGNCNAFFGEGDPYLPFRDVLSRLTGAEAGQFVLEPGNSEVDVPILRAVPLVLDILINQSQALLDVFVSSSKLRKIIAARVERPDFWIQKLDAAAERSRALNRERTQRQHFQSFTQLLRDISEQYPLLIILDDLQWADSASIHLLFHLAQRVANSRILLVAAYRASEIAVTRPRPGIETDSEHPLAPVIQELIRQFGDMSVELRRLEKVEGQAFVSALLDSESNRLGQDFRDSLLQKTNGHPLFTVELLRDMQARGELIQDSRGQWYEKQPVDWAAMPVRVEAVIRRRVDRLDAGLRKIVDVGSVEGEVFSAQVVMKVLEKSEWQILNDLSRELQSRHQLVLERAEVLVEGRPQALYQFSHPLFHEHVYRSLSVAERRWLHGQVGNVLEEEYGDQVDEIVTQLARHFELAGSPKALGYLLQAGEIALAKYASAEAENHFRRALDLNPPAAARARLQGGLAEALYRQGYKDEALEAWRRGIDDFKALRSLEELALLYASALWHLLPYWPAEGLQLCAEALSAVEGLEEGVPLAHLMHQVARAYLFNYLVEQAVPLCKKAVEIGEQRGDIDLQADALSTLGVLELWTGENLDNAFVTLHRAVSLAEASGSLHLIFRASSNLGVSYYRLQGRHREALKIYLRAAELARQLGAVEKESYALANVFFAHTQLGDFSSAGEIIEEIGRLQQETPQPQATDFLRRQLKARLARMCGNWDEALALIEDSLAEARRFERVELISILILEDYILLHLDLHLFRSWSDWALAESALREVLNLGAQSLPQHVKALLLLSIVYARQENVEAAHRYLEEEKHSAARLPEWYLLPYRLWTLSELAVAGKRWDEAISLMTELVEITSTTDKPWERAHRLLELAEIHRRRSDADDSETAQTLYKVALQMFSEMGATGFVEVIKGRLDQV